MMKVSSSRNKSDFLVKGMHSSVNCIVCLLVIFVSFSAQSEERAVEANIFQSGLNDYQKGEYYQAIQRLTAAIDSVSGCTEVALDVTAMNDPVKALSDLTGNNNGGSSPCENFNKADLWDAYFYLALAYLKTGDKSSAHKEIENAKSTMAEKRPDLDAFPEVADWFPPPPIRLIAGEEGRPMLPNEQTKLDVQVESNETLTTESDRAIEEPVEEKWEVELQRGIKEYETGNYHNALLTLRAVIKDIPRGDGVDCLSLKDPAKMMSCIQGADIIRGHKDNSLWNAHFYIANSYFLSGEMCIAIKKFEETKALDSKSKPDSDIFSPKIVSLYESDLSVMYNARCGEPPPPRCPDPNDPRCEKCEEFYCKWWFWVGIAAAAGLAAGGGGGSEGGGGGDETVVVNW